MSDDRPRRSAGMRGSPFDTAPAHRPVAAIAKAPAKTDAPAGVSMSRYAKPKILMGEVAAPVAAQTNEQITAQRQALRAFMISHRLSPTGWCRDAGVSPGELLAFLGGRSGAMPAAALDRLATAAGVTAGVLLGG